MDSDGAPSSGPKKLRFGPKPLRKTPKPVATEIGAGAEKEIDDRENQASLDRRLQEHLSRKTARPEYKSAPVQVTFTHEGGSGSSLRTFGTQSGETWRSAASDLDECPRDHTKALVAAVSADGIQEVRENSESSSDDEAEEQKEPWYTGNSYYPTTLPWKEPSSGNPDVLGKEKSNHVTETEEKSAASELGLLDKDNKETRMIFFQFPPTLPYVGNQIHASEIETGGKLKAIKESAKGKEKAGSFRASNTANTTKGSRLEEMPKGFMGKLVVYKNGSVKLKLGDVLYDVSPGMRIKSDGTFMAVDVANKTCTALGGVDSRAVVSLDMDSL